MVKKLIIIIGILLNVNLIFAVNCGGDVECYCGDTLTQDYLLNKSLNCQDNGLRLKNYVTLDCQGYKIQGNKNGNGIELKGDSITNVKNCFISNFTNGIYINREKRGKYYYYPKENNIFDNILKNNDLGIYYNSANYENYIYDNKFIENKNSGIRIFKSSKGNIWNNYFYNTGIFYDYQPIYMQFCKNGLKNTYFNNAKGPKCDCIVPYDNLKLIYGDVNFCEDKYYFENGIQISSESNILHKEVNLDCNNATFIGNNQGIGLKIAGSYDNNIKNCNFENYDVGIYLTSAKYGYSTIFSTRNKIFNSKIFNVNNGVIMSKNSFIDLSENEIIAKNKNLVFDSPYFIDAKNNYWGSNNLTYISNKIDNKSDLYEFKPILIKNGDVDLEVGSINFIDNKIYLNIKNKGNLFSSYFKIKIVETKNDEIIQENIVETDEIIKANLNKEFIFNWNIDEGDNFKIYLDFENEIEELNELNNFYNFDLCKKNKFYLNIDLKPSILEDTIREYLIQNIGDEFIVSKDESDIEINIGEGNFFKNKPYSAKIVSNISNINVLAGGSVGYIGAVKELILNFEDFVRTENRFLINESNIEVIGIYDYLTNERNRKYFNKNLISFKNLVKNSLENQMFNFEEKFIPIELNGSQINYRIWHLSSNKSDLLKSYVDNDGLPIVMSGGIYSNIEEWQEFGQKLANEGFEVYLIEMNGGNNSECENCYDYTYQDLTNIVYPSYLDFILEDSNRNNIKYVGHSNGCRVALDSLYRNNISIDSFIGLGCPILLNEKSGTSKDIRKFNSKYNLSQGHLAIKKLREENKTHIYRQEYSKNLRFLGRLATSDYKISTNLQDFYNNLTIEENSSFKINDVADEHLFFAGNSTYGISFYNYLDHYNDDGVVPVQDLIYLNNSLSHSNLIIDNNLNHGTLIKNRQILKVVEEELK